jgi:Kef-type K+ transport system membrane component KefB
MLRLLTNYITTLTLHNSSPVGQLIIAAAVIDDMIALIVLSMLKTLTTEITVATILIPVVSALGFLFIGGYIAIFVAPQFIHRFLLGKVEERYHAKIELAIMFGLLLGLMPATYYSKASFLMGAFLSGLVFCSSHGLHALFVSQFKRILAWLMRIFFAASIG